MDDVRLALRRLTQRKGATIASILTLACSIGAAAATWSLLSSVLLRPLPIRDPDRVFVVGQVWEARGMPAVGETHTYPMLRRVREAGVFAQAAAGGGGNGPLLVETAGAPVRTPVYFATHDWFDLLGVSIPIGRPFTAAEDTRGAAPVAILSDQYWRRTFDADPQVLGRVLTVAGVKTTVVGVAPPRFRGLSLAASPDLFLPLHSVAAFYSVGTNFFEDAGHPTSPTAWVAVIGRLRAGGDAQAVAARLASTGPAVPGRPAPRYVAVPIDTAALPAAVRAGMRQFTRLLAVTVGLLLLIGCTTVGMLFLVRSEARREEMATCLALGASRIRLARGVALEGLLVSCAGAALALPAAHWLFALARTFQLPGSVPVEMLGLTVDMRVGLACAASALAATSMVAILAGAFAFSSDIAGALRSRTGATPAARRTRSLLVVAQVAVALVLLVGSGLLLRSLSAALHLNPGFATDHLITGDAFLAPYGYTPARAAEYAATLAARLRVNPAIAAFALTANDGGMTPAGRLVIDGVPRQFPTMVVRTAIDDRYFATLGLHVLQGRDFAATDAATAPLVAIVSESFGRMIASGGNPLGRRILSTVRIPPAAPPPIEIVGVVPDIITDVTIAEPLVMYLPMTQVAPRAAIGWVARATGPTEAAQREIAATLKALDPRTPTAMRTLQERLGQQMGPQRFGSVVLGTLGVIAVLLTALGTYVLTASLVALRTRELAIRAALGATGRALSAIVLREAGRLVGLGLIVGLVLVWLGGSTIRAFLFRIQPLDPATLVAAAGLILALALAVSLGPARRAARVDLARVMRE